MKRSDGGPAFARPASEYTASGTLSDGNEAVRDQDGMSLRDYFAAKAMQAIIAKTTWLDESESLASERERFFNMTASGAYNYADAMLAERAKVPA